VDADKLTELLAVRLAALVPDGFHVRACGRMLRYSGEPRRSAGQLSGHQAGAAGTFVRDNLEGRGEMTEELLTGVVAQALDELQDYVDEASHDPWPGTRTPPRPFAQVRGKVLHAWYGGPDITSPVILACAPLSLAQIERSR